MGKYNPEYARRYYQENKEHIKRKSTEWAKRNPERVAKIRKTYIRKYKSDPKNARKLLQKRVEYRKSNPEKVRAQNKLNHAIRKGYIKKQYVCSDCGKVGGPRCIQGYHHRGYEYPLDVIWLCPACRYNRSKA